MQSAEINPKQRAFIDEYLVDLNATQAAIRAGYSPRSAEVTGFRLLNHAKIAAAIAAARQARSERTQITADRVLEELAAVGFARITDVVSWQEGPWGTEITAKPSSEIDGRVVASIRPVAVGKLKTGVEIKLHDKLGALAKLGDHLGLWKKEPEPQGDPLRIVIVEDE